MTQRVPAAPRAAAVPSPDAEMTDERSSVRERHNFRAGFWRLALGALGLFWVCVLLALLS